jgi:hypothetical protein
MASERGIGVAGHDQHIRVVTTSYQFGTLQNAEAMLLVDDGEAEVIEFDRLPE